jgi:hypothetical protein
MPVNKILLLLSDAGDKHTSIQLTGKLERARPQPYSEKANAQSRDYAQVGEPEKKKLPVDRPCPRGRSRPRDCCDYFHLVSPFDHKEKSNRYASWISG